MYFSFYFFLLSLLSLSYFDITYYYYRNNNNSIKWIVGVIAKKHRARSSTFSEVTLDSSKTYSYFYFCKNM